MKFLPILAALLGLTASLHAQDKAALKQIAADYEKIESEYQLWPHYTYSAENLEGGHTYEHHVWKSDGDEGFIKVRSLNFDDHGESKTEFFLKGADLFFSFDRSETTAVAPKAPTEVHETRYYFAKDQLIRQLRKQGTFPAGAKKDTTNLKNEELPPSGDESPAETYVTQHEIAAQVIERARALDSDDPLPSPAEPPPAQSSRTITGEGWRMIAGSASRDGDYALAWGFKDGSKARIEVSDNGDANALDEDQEDLVNYVVDLRTKQIIGKVAGKHFGDRDTYNHISNETAWSSGSDFVVQLNSFKWHTATGVVYKIENETLSAGADLIGPATAAVFQHLKGSPQLKKFKREDFAITLHDPRLVWRVESNILEIEVLGQIPKHEDEDASFEATAIFALKPASKGVAPSLILTGVEVH